MNLTKHYHALDMRQRLLLFVSAGERGDEAEQAAVVAASEQISVVRVDIYPHVMALNTACMVHRINQADLAFAVASFLTVPQMPPHAKYYAAYLMHIYLVTEAAWRIICEEHGLDYDRTAQRLDAGCLMPLADYTAQFEGKTLSASEFAEINKQLAGTPFVLSSLPTVEEKCAEYREAIETLADKYVAR